MVNTHKFGKLPYIGGILIALLGLYLSSLYSYILFHSLIEIVTIAIAFALFILTWNTHRYLKSSYLRLLGIGYAFIAFIDLIHTLAYKGMGVFPTFGSNQPTQLWIAARYLQAITLLVAPFLVERRMDNRTIVGIYAVAVSTLVAMVFSGNFPDCYIEGQGLTPFKINSEYVISAALLVALYLFYRQRKYFDHRVFFLISASIGCSVLSEISFTAYVSVYGFANLVGHFAKLAAFYLIYQAILVTGLKEPYDLIFRDLKQAEETLRKSQDTLTERTHELAESNRQLQIAKDDAVQANQAKSVFLAHMSHELRTPLHAVLGFSQLMRNDLKATAEQKEYLNIINRSGEYLLNLINNVLDISKIEAGQVTLEEIQLDLHQVVQELRSLMYVRAEEKGLSFSVTQSQDLPRLIMADPSKLRQILINLIGNAIKYTQHGQVILRASVVAWTSAQEARLRFEVADTGPGIRAEDQARIFSPFVQLANQSTAQVGTGLGLAICKQYVELMGGQLGVASELGNGSVFHVEMPVVVLPVEEPSAESLHGRVIGLAAGQPRYRVLITDDQPESRLLLRKLLEPLGFDLHEATNGAEAITCFEQWQPDLIWMDIRMSMIDGLEATRRIKASATGARTKIIALTAHALEDERREIVAAGFDDFVRKPYRTREIFDTLAKHLGVQFQYAEEQAWAEPGAGELEAARFSQLPPALIAELQSAVELLDERHCSETISRIDAIDHALGKQLQRMVQNLQYKELISMLDTLNPKER